MVFAVFFQEPEFLLSQNCECYRELKFRGANAHVKGGCQRRAKSGSSATATAKEALNLKRFGELHAVEEEIRGI